MLVDGKAIAEDILKDVAKAVKALGRTPCLTAVTCAPNFETKKYLEMKKRKAESTGITLNVVELPAGGGTAVAWDCVHRVANDSDGVVIQLPLPPKMNQFAIIAGLPVDKDPDGFHYGENKAACFPPVVGAIDEISQRYEVEWEGKKVAVLGEGLLVGRPAAAYAAAIGAEVSVLTKKKFDEEKLATADIIISGIGQPHFIKPEMVKEGVVVFDAGTSEEGGELVGDADPEVAGKASLFTPVPGGIGPITIAYLFRNLTKLASQ